ncbi:MAG: hypothetical protein WC479_11365 [Candidatus Izemoplasmatales bacterium]
MNKTATEERKAVITTIDMFVEPNEKYGDKLVVTDSHGKTWKIKQEKSEMWEEFSIGKQTDISVGKYNGFDFIKSAKLLGEDTASQPIPTPKEPIPVKTDLEKRRGVALSYAGLRVDAKVIPVSDIFIFAALCEEYMAGNILFDRKDLLAYQVKLQSVKE